jgi:hypothetical protein
MSGMNMGSDDPLLMALRYAPIVFVIVGLGLVMWLQRQRLPQEWQPDVLDALSETEALPPTAIRDRPPLAHQDLDLRTLESVLEVLCHTGQAVRWYEEVAAPDSASSGSSPPSSRTPSASTPPRRQPVYRRVAPPR